MPNDTLPEAVVEEIARALALDCDCDPDVFVGLHGNLGHFGETAKNSLAPIIARLIAEAREAGVQQGMDMAAGDSKAAIRAVMDGVKPVAWETHHDKPMLFHNRGEASLYCDPDEDPIALYSLDALKEAIGHD